jgi:alkylation response protein AidB-like acyl-CoA dehydrogenase
MDFTVSDEHKMLEESICRLLDQELSDRPPANLARGWQPHIWRALADVGALASALPEDKGGMPPGSISTMLIVQSLGYRLIATPFIPTIVCAANLLARFGTAEQQSNILQPILQGECVIALAHAESNHGEQQLDVRVTAREEGSAFVLNGRKRFVVGASSANYLLVVTRFRGDTAHHSRLGAFLVPAHAEGIELITSETIDRGVASEVCLSDVKVGSECLVAFPGTMGRESIEQMLDAATVAHCAEAMGSMKAMFEKTVAYSKQRQQFGRAIGQFQTLQHRMVDMLIACEQASAIVQHASLCLESEEITRKRATSACKVTVGRTGRMVGQSAVQMHGAIGITDELDVTQHFRRVEAFNLRLGTIDEHVSRYVDLLSAV